MASTKYIVDLKLTSGKITTVSVPNDTLTWDNKGGVNWELSIDFDGQELTFESLKKVANGKNYNVIAYFTEGRSGSNAISETVNFSEEDYNNGVEMEILLAVGVAEATGTTPRRIRRIVEVSQA